MPAGRNAVLTLKVPLELSVAGLPGVLPVKMFTAGGLPAGVPVFASSKTTTPLGVPLPELFETVPLSVVAPVPAVPDTVAGKSVTLVLIKLGVDHLLIRFATFTDPNPVARSYPAPAANAGTSGVPDTNTPNPPVVVLLQFVEAPVHGTEMLPLVMSLKTQVVLLELPLFPTLELQLEKGSLFAIAYNVGFALPCR